MQDTRRHSAAWWPTCGRPPTRTCGGACLRARSQACLVPPQQLWRQTVLGGVCACGLSFYLVASGMRQLSVDRGKQCRGGAPMEVPAVWRLPNPPFRMRVLEKCLLGSGFKLFNLVACRRRRAGDAASRGAGQRRAARGERPYTADRAGRGGARAAHEGRHDRPVPVRQVPAAQVPVLPDADAQRGRANDHLCDLRELRQPLEVLLSSALVYQKVLEWNLTLSPWVFCVSLTSSGC